MPVKVVLFDVFGTLVDYEPDTSRLAYPQTHALLTTWGFDGSHDDFVNAWAAVSKVLEDDAERTNAEYAMPTVADAFTAAVMPSLSSAQRAELLGSFMAEWRLGVHAIDGVAEMVRRLGETYRLGVVSNTHDSNVVPTLLTELGIRDAFDMVLLSVDHGYRKPHPTIYTAALDAMGSAPTDTAFVGDTHAADFVGPSAAGITAFLIDPADRFGVPADRRLAHICDLEAALARI